MGYNYKAEYENILKKRQEAQQLAEQAAEKSFEANAFVANQQLPILEQNALKNRKALQLNYQKQRSTMGEQMARLGLYGTGAAEAAKVSARNAYNTNLANVNQTLAEGKRDVQNAIAGYRAQTEANKANIKAQFAADMPSLYQQYARYVKEIRGF